MRLESKLILLALGVVAALTCSHAVAAPRLPYQDARLPIDARVRDLVGRMTLEEKLMQVTRPRPGLSALDAQGELVSDDARVAWRHGAAIIGVPGACEPTECARKINRAQKFLVEETRLGIPALVVSEALHGAMIRRGTMFPQAIALASTWDPDLLEAAFAAAARELRAIGVGVALAPVLDLAREPRWGRTEETLGEDPFLVATLGTAIVRGMQGEAGADPNRIIAAPHVGSMLKHFVGHGQPEGGRNTAPVSIGQRALRETHLVPFAEVIRRAQPVSVMAQYNEIDGVPTHADRWLLHDVLIGELGFRGYVSSDHGAVEDLVRVHRAAANEVEAARLALEAGIDFEASDDDSAFDSLRDELASGRVARATLDRAVARVVRAKLRLGLFDVPYVDEAAATAIVGASEHRALARRAAEEAIVLVKNEGELLPFDANRLRKLAVIGPNAGAIHLGGYSFEPFSGTSVVEGLRAFAPGKLEVLHAEGCRITAEPGSFWKGDFARPSDPALDAKLMKEAVALARGADAVLLVLGENESTNREAWSEKHLGDRDELGLIGRQMELARQVMALGKPTAVLLLGGRPLAVAELVANARAVLVGWYLGQETGPVVADVLFGNVNPSGKLPVTFPRTTGELPVFYAHKASRMRTYLFRERTAGPLFPFGHGLSYTQFRYAGRSVSPARIGAHDTAEVTVEVTNVGRRVGTEVVQLYLTPKASLPTRPVQALRGFARVTLAPGQTQRVSFRIGPDELAARDLRMRHVVAPGEYELALGGSSATLERAKLTVAR